MFSKRRPDKLTEEERQIEKAREALLRKQNELQKRMVRLPAEIAAKREERMRVVRERARTAQVTNIGGVRQGVRRHGRTASRRAYDERIRFFILLLILVVLGALVWYTAGSKGFLPEGAPRFQWGIKN